MRQRLLIVAILLVGCSGQQSEQDERGQDEVGTPQTAVPSDLPEAPARGARQADAIQASARDDWIEHAFLPSGSTRDALLAAFGGPDHVMARPIRNAYDSSVVDTVFEWVWTEGLTAWVYAGPEREFITRAEVTSSRFLRRSHVGIGDEWQEVMQEFGPPWGELDGLPFYDSGQRIGPEEPVYFRVEDGRVSLIRFEYYTG